MSTKTNLLSPDVFFKLKMLQKTVFGRRSAPDPAGGSLQRSPRPPIVDWEGHIPSPFPSSTPSASQSRRLLAPNIIASFASISVKSFQQHTLASEKPTVAKLLIAALSCTTQAYRRMDG